MHKDPKVKADPRNVQFKPAAAAVWHMPGIAPKMAAIGVSMGRLCRLMRKPRISALPVLRLQLTSREGHVDPANREQIHWCIIGWARFI